jgi:hypothetical protein
MEITGKQKNNKSGQETNYIALNKTFIRVIHNWQASTKSMKDYICNALKIFFIKTEKNVTKETYKW